MKSRMVAKLLAAIALISMKAGASVSTSVAVISIGQDAANLNAQYCNSSTHSHMWGDVDPNIFYICDEVSSTARKLRCPMGRGFFKGHGYYGCIPYNEWPACIDNSTRSDAAGSNATAQVCSDEEYLQQTWTAVDPNKFYICQEENNAPQLMNCEPGKGYVSTWTNGGHDSIHIVGCAAWEKWRMYMHCEGFY
ncbi:uncharacterized protein LOC128859273 [Anastrepha ludens]|uniref:uncharacterized protein LOC128859273 n=1 Tax=Anastrepha ludens TaxID=28586 RepID=UPI0023B1A4F3|nr:uncharacterized protein LOC128859273 [Anastrepha ludens]